MVGSPPHLYSLPTLNFLESLSRTLGNLRGEGTPNTVLHLCEQLEQTQPGETSEGTGPCAWPQGPQNGLTRNRPGFPSQL